MRVDTPQSLTFLLASALVSLPIQALYLRQLPHAPNTKAPRAAALDWDDSAIARRIPQPAPAPPAVRQSAPNTAPPLTFPADMTKRVSSSSSSSSGTEGGGYLANRELENLLPAPPPAEEQQQQPSKRTPDQPPNNPTSPHLYTKRDAAPPLPPTTTNNKNNNKNEPPNPETETISISDLPLTNPLPPRTEAPPQPPLTNPLQQTHQQHQASLRYTAEAAHINVLAARALAEQEARAAARATEEWKKERVRREEARSGTKAAREEKAEAARAAREREARALERVVERERQWIGEKAEGEEKRGDPLVGGREAWRRDLLERLDILAGIAVE